MGDEVLLAKLDVITERQQKQLDDHEERIRFLEDVSSVVKQIGETVSRQGENIDKITNTQKLMQDTQQEMLLKVKEIELKSQYSTYIKIRNILKNLDFKKVVMALCGTGALGVIVRLILDLMK